jgi:isocitrate dehydrogenase
MFSSASRQGLRSVLRMMSQGEGYATKIIYTKCDEAPALATYSLLPIIRKFCSPLGIEVDLSDISVAARVIHAFNDRLKPEQQVPDNLGNLGDLSKTPEANIIKLPNISASIPQLHECIAELQAHGYNVPNYPESPQTAEEKEINERYSRVLGSAVNPVLREGNSDRRVAAPVKKYAQKNPHKLGAWPKPSKTVVAHMSDKDFFANEKSYTAPSATTVTIALNGKKLKDVALQEGEVIDASYMQVGPLRDFIREQIDYAKSQGILFSLHLKATMMKISDPIMFGHVVKVFYEDVFAKHADTFAKLGVNANNGIGDVYDKIKSLPEAQQKEIEADIQKQYETRPDLAMVDSSKGITNLHVPSDVIIDASMPVVVRDEGKMWNKDDKLQECVCVIPDRSYAPAYKAIVEDVKANGQFDVSTMGNVANVGLMAQKAEEYGSHDKTFEAPEAGTMTVTDASGKVIFEHNVNKGDIWRMAQTKDAPIKDWVGLAVNRARATGSKATFWLNKDRAHDAQIIAKVNTYLKDHDTKGLELDIKAPADAMTEACTRARAGKDTISVTGNVLRDYLTDLFPILELGTSAKMLSIVPMLAGGAMFETGAGGSAPKHVQQFEKENHLRWDSLGEYLAMACSLDFLGDKTGDKNTKLAGQTLTDAVGQLLDNRKSPGRKVMQLDNRGSNFYVSLYWAQELAKQDPSFKQIAEDLAANEEQIVKELIDCQGPKMDVGGYYQPNDELATKAMNPSPTLNKIMGLSV